jgi:hypothetical protein
MAAHPAPHRATPALVGRDREQAVLREALTAALAGRGALVLLGGEAGLGKTTLAESLLAEAASLGALVLVGRCYDLTETPPYGCAGRVRRFTQSSIPRAAGRSSEEDDFWVAHPTLRRKPRGTRAW